MTSVAEYIKSIPLTSIAGIAAANLPAQTKRRAAVVAHDAYLTIDGYMAARPTLFYGGLMVAASGAAMAVKRYRQGPEAVAAWLVMAVMGGAVAYVTKPTAPTTAGAPGGTPAMETVNAWLDARAVSLDRAEPGWEQRALTRLLG